MANRPKLKTIQSELAQLKATVQDHEGRLKGMEEREIVKLLEEKNYAGSDRPRYTYQEIAEITGVSAAKVNNIAAKNNLSRRNLKSV